MKKETFFGTLLLTITTIIFFIIILYKIYSAFTYGLLVLLLTFTIVLINRFKLLTANTLFTIFFQYAVGLGPIILLVKGIEYNYDYYKIIIGGLLAFAWGNLIFIRKSEIKQINKNDKVSIRFKIQRKAILKIFYLISLLAAIYYIYKNKVLLLGGNLSSGRITAMAGSGIILYTLQLSILIIPMMYDLYFYGKKNKLKIVSKFELFIMIGISSIMLLFTGFRAPLITMYICLIILIVEKNNISNKKIIPLGIALIILVEFLGIIRSNLSGGSMNILSIVNSFSTSLFVNCINLKYIFNVFPLKVPFQYGYTYLINFLMLLPGPDLDFTLWLKEQININFSGGGVTPTILGEFYINFGITSIYIGMFILGAIGNSITKFFRKHKKNFLGSFYIWQFAHCASGGIANVIILVILYTIIYWFLMMFPEYIGERSNG